MNVFASYLHTRAAKRGQHQEVVFGVYDQDNDFVLLDLSRPEEVNVALKILMISVY